ncbi:MAG TPA: MmgE/PrpD family protein [Nitrolancea sp.]
MYLAEMMANYALDLAFEDLPEAVVDAALRATADTLACAVGAIGEEGPELLRDFAVARASMLESSLIGSGEQINMPLAALVNCSLARDLDANDLYAGTPGRDTGHFSDAIPALLAVAEAIGASGRDFITSVVIAYELQAVLAESYLWMQGGLHSVSQVAWALPAAAGRLLRLRQEQIVSAIGLAGTTGGLILQSWLKPSPKLSLIKGGAPGFAAQHALEAVDLAADGYTAPQDALETLFDRFPSGTDQTAFQNLTRPFTFTTPRNMLKQYPAQIYTQSAAQAAVALHEQIDSVDDIAVATVYGHRNVVAGVQGSAGAYRPETRGAADHSTPFVVAVGLRDGDLTPASYDDEPWTDEELLDLMRRVDLVIDPEFERAFVEDGRFGCRLVVELHDGRRLEQTVSQQKGHPDNPLSRDELLAKMQALTMRNTDEAFAERLLDTVNALSAAANVNDLVRLLRVDE